MWHYFVKRLLLIIPTMLGILAINFLIVQILPGGPVESLINELTGTGVTGSSRISGVGGGEALSQAAGSISQSATPNAYKASQGLDEEFIAQLEAYYGFDKPAWERFYIMLINYVQFDLGESYFRDVSVIDLVIEKMPVSISLGVWTTLLVYLISIPLGIRKAVKDGSAFDVNTSVIISIGYAIPSFLFAVLLIVLFAGGSYWQIFPLRGLTSPNFEELSMMGKVLDYLWHITLPVLAMVVGGFASLTMLTKNSFLEEINKQYVMTARAKGLKEKRILYGHILRNAMLIVVAGFPAAFIGMLFTGAFMIEVVFSLDGLGLLGFEALVKRDYPVVLGTLYIFSLLGLILNLIGDLMYVLIDPRINFERQSV